MIRGHRERYVSRIDSTYLVVMVGERKMPKEPKFQYSSSTFPRIFKQYMATYISSSYPTYPTPVPHYHAEPPGQRRYISHPASLSPVHNAAPS